MAKYPQIICSVVEQNYLLQQKQCEHLPLCLPSAAYSDEDIVAIKCTNPAMNAKKRLIKYINSDDCIKLAFYSLLETECMRAFRNVGIAGGFSKCWLLLFMLVKETQQNCGQLLLLDVFLGSWYSLLDHLLIAWYPLLINSLFSSLPLFLQLQLLRSFSADCNSVILDLFLIWEAFTWEAWT